MSPSTATLIGAGVIVITNLLTAAFVYGQLTQKVNNLEKRMDRWETRTHGD